MAPGAGRLRRDARIRVVWTQTAFSPRAGIRPARPRTSSGCACRANCGISALPPSRANCAGWWLRSGPGRGSSGLLSNISARRKLWSRLRCRSGRQIRRTEVFGVRCRRRGLSGLQRQPSAGRPRGGTGAGGEARPVSALSGGGERREGPALARRPGARPEGPRPRLSPSKKKAVGRKASSVRNRDSPPALWCLTVFSA